MLLLTGANGRTGRAVLQALEDTSASPVMGMPSSVGGEWRSPPPKLDEHGAAIRAKGWSSFPGP